MKEGIPQQAGHREGTGSIQGDEMPRHTTFTNGMSKSTKQHPTIADELVMGKIYTIRGVKVMLDRDLADLYGLDTKRLKEAVRRNKERFPEDFMFEMNADEFQNWRTQIATSNPGDRMGLRYAPFCFTEHGVLMLSNVLRSKQAIAMSIRIIQVFVRMRAVLSTHSELLLKLEKLSGTVSHHSRDIKAIFGQLRRMREEREEEETRRLLAQVAKDKEKEKKQHRPVVGFKVDKDKK